MNEFVDEDPLPGNLLVVQEHPGDYSGDKGGEGETGEEHVTRVQNGVADNVIHNHGGTTDPRTQVVTDQSGSDKAETKLEDGGITYRKLTKN